MRAVLVLCVLGIAVVASEYTQGSNGRPGCKTADELKRPWRNNFDPTRYWVCKTLGEPAVEELCKTNEGFMSEPELKCVDWSDWTWTPPYDPPSLA